MLIPPSALLVRVEAQEDLHQWRLVAEDLVLEASARWQSARAARILNPNSDTEGADRVARTHLLLETQSLWWLIAAELELSSENGAGQAFPRLTVQELERSWTEVAQFYRHRSFVHPLERGPYPVFTWAWRHLVRYARGLITRTVPHELPHWWPL